MKGKFKQTLKDIVTKPPLKQGEYVHSNVWLIVSHLSDDVEISVGHSIGTAVQRVVRLGVWTAAHRCVREILVQI